MSDKERYFSKDEVEYMKRIFVACGNIKTINEFRNSNCKIDKAKSEVIQQKLDVVISNYNFNSVKKIFQNAINDVTKSKNQINVGGAGDSIIDFQTEAIEDDLGDLFDSIFVDLLSSIYSGGFIETILNTYSTKMIYIIKFSMLNAGITIMNELRNGNELTVESIIKQNIIIIQLVKSIKKWTRIDIMERYFPERGPVMEDGLREYINRNLAQEIASSNELVDSIRRHLSGIEENNTLSSLTTDEIRTLLTKKRDTIDMLQRAIDTDDISRKLLQPPISQQQTSQQPIPLTTETKSIFSVVSESCINFIYGIGGIFVDNDDYDGGRIMRKNRRKSRKNRRKSRKNRRKSRKNKRIYV